MKMTMGKESKLQTACLKHAAQFAGKNVLAVNIHGGGFCNRGFPDLLLCIGGRFIAVELKVGKNGLEPAQRIWKERIERAGGAHYEARSPEQFQRILKMELERYD